MDISTGEVKEFQNPGFEKLSKNFEKIFIINSENLKLFPKIASLVVRQGWKQSFKEINKLPSKDKLRNKIGENIIFKC